MLNITWKWFTSVSPFGAHQVEVADLIHHSTTELDTYMANGITTFMKNANTILSDIYEHLGHTIDGHLGKKNYYIMLVCALMWHLGHKQQLFFFTIFLLIEIDKTY